MSRSAMGHRSPFLERDHTFAWNGVVQVGVYGLGRAVFFREAQRRKCFDSRHLRRSCEMAPPASCAAGIAGESARAFAASRLRAKECAALRRA